MTDSKTSFTLGPWAYQEKSDAYTHIVRAPENRFICQLRQDRSGIAEANAHLIAAAPDLYAALQEAEEILSDLPDEGDSYIQEVRRQANQALAKARGEDT